MENTARVVIPLSTPEEFRHMVIEALCKDSKDMTHEDIWSILLDSGMEKLTMDNLAKFMKSLAGKVFLPNVAVGFGDSQWIWLVSGTNAILISKDSVKVFPNG